MLGFDEKDLKSPFFRGTNGNGQIVRPPWVGYWDTAPLQASEDRCHTVAFNHIAEAMVNLINKMWQEASSVAALGTVPTATSAPIASIKMKLSGFCNSLYPNGGGTGANLFPEHGVMTNHMNALVDRICLVGSFLSPTQQEIADLADAANLLESDLMSAPENVRPGDSTLNQRLSDNIDPPLVDVILPPSPGPVQGLQASLLTPWGVAGNWGMTLPPGQRLNPNDRFYAIECPSNAIVYRFMDVAPPWLGKDVTILRNDDPNNPVPGWAWGGQPPWGGQPITSTPTPTIINTAGDWPVLAFDPTGTNLPYRFG